MNQPVDDFTNKKTTGSVLLVENIKNDYNETYIYQIARKSSIEITFKYCQTISELILNRVDNPRYKERICDRIHLFLFIIEGFCVCFYQFQFINYLIEADNLVAGNQRDKKQGWRLKLERKMSLIITVVV